jgi:hypothetical protein
MGTASAKQLTAALVKAKAVGMVEEGFTIGDCEVVLRNLRPDEYEAVVAETSEYDDLAYLNAYQKSHVCRSIVEVNGVDLRDIDFVEVEEPDPKDKTKTKTVKRELHDWIRRYVLSTWSKEAIYTAYRKFSDVLFIAEKKSQEKVTFVVAEETAEEKYRRLLGELRELEGEVPPAIVKSSLEEFGYAHYTREEDTKALEDFVAEASGNKKADEPVAESEPVPVPRPPEPVEADPAMRAAQLMRQRVPLSQRDAPPPVSSPASVAPPAAPPLAAPVYVPPAVTTLSGRNRSAEIAEVMSEGLSDAEIENMRAPAPQAVVPPGMAPPPGMDVPTSPVTGPKAVLTKQGAHHTDPNAMASILNPSGPVGVINPKFRPQFPGRR